MKTVDMLALFDARLMRQGNGTEPERDPRIPVPIDWAALFARENNAEWLVENLWPVGRQCHLHAARKQGKSLVALWIACELSCGRDPFSGTVIPPVRVGYFDYEMTEDDLLERIEEMGYTPDDLALLHYFLHPAIPKLDTYSGGQALMDTLASFDITAIVIDTMSRVVEGDENSNDTYIHFYGHTGAMLKAAGIAMLRLDHEGHESGRSRGASAKADDVDIVWQLKVTEVGMDFVRKASRISWVPELLPIKKITTPTLAFQATTSSWPAGTYEKAKELDELGAPMEISKRAAITLLKEHGLLQGKTVVLMAALRYRKTRILGL